MPAPIAVPADEFAEALFVLSPSATLLCDPVQDASGSLVAFALCRANPAAQHLLQLPTSPAYADRTYGLSPAEAEGLVYLRAAYEAGLATPFRLLYPVAGRLTPFLAMGRRVGEALLLSLTPAPARNVVGAGVSGDPQRDLHQVLELAPVAVASLTGPHHVFTFLNPAYAQLLGGRPVLGLPVRQALPDLNDQAFPGLLDEVYRTGEPFVGHEMLVQYDRTYSGRVEDTYFNFLYQATRDAAGGITGVILFAYDVTDAVQARLQTQQLNTDLHRANQQLEARVQARTREVEQARAAAEAQRLQLAQLFEQAPVAICVFRGPALVLDVVNPPMERMLGRPLDQLLGRPFADALPDLARQGLPAVLAQVQQTGHPYVAQEQEILLERHGQGPPGYYTFTYQPIQDAHRRVTAVACVAVEVTGLVTARRVAERSEQRFRQLTEATPMIVWEADAQGQTTYLSPRWEPFTTAANGQGLGWQQYMHPDDQDSFLQAWLAAVAAGQPFAAEMRLRVAATGEFRWHLDRAVPVHDAAGNLIQWVGAAIDIHEQKLAEQHQHDLTRQLRLANEQLRRTNADLDNFIYTASHDLRAPITNIDGLLVALREQLGPHPVAQVPELLDMMQGAVERFQRTIAELGDIVQLQQAHAQPAEAVDLAALIAAVRLDLAPQLAAAAAQVDVDVEACPHVSFAPRHLRSIVYNLLSNAVKYRHPGRPARVAVRCRRAAGEVVLEVQDNGLGLTEQQQGKLFGMFQRLHTHVAGSGIGLYMVKRIVDNAGGRIAVASQPNLGTTFTVQLPA